LANIGQLLKFDLPRFAAVPAVELPRVGMRAEARHLLAVAEKFELFSAAIRRDDVGDDLRKHLGRTKQYRAFGRLADAHEDVTALLVTFAHMILDRTNRFLVEDVDVERRHGPP